MSEILEKAKELVDDIYKAMTKVETCETLSEEVASQEVVLVKGGSDRYIKLDGVLTEEQMQDVKKYIQNTIDGNKAEAERFLRRVSGKAATINPDFEEAVQEMVANNERKSNAPDEPEAAEEESQESDKTVEEVAVEEEERDSPELTVEAVRKIYTEGDMTVRQAADYFKVSQSKLYGFISDHGLRKAKKDNTPWRSGGHK